MPLNNNAPADNSYDPKLKKKYTEWIKLAEAKHKVRVADVASEYLKYLDQEFKAVTDDKNQSVYNYYYTNLRRLIPELLPKDIKIKVTPKDGKETVMVGGQEFNNKQAAIILNTKINQEVLSKKSKYQIKQSVFDLLIANLSCIVVGQTTIEDTQDVIPEGIDNLLQDKAQNGDLIPGETPIPEAQTELKGCRLILMRESFKNIMVDPESTDYFFNDKKYAVRIVRLSPEEAKEKYGDIPGDIGNEYISIKGMEGRMEQAKKKCLYEVYDYTGPKIKRITFLGKGARFLEEVEFDHDPLKLCKLNYMPDETYPASDMKYYKSLVEESNFYRTIAMNQTDRGAARKVLVEAEALDEEAQGKIKSDKDMEIVTVDTKGKGLGGSIEIFESKRPPAEASMMNDRIRGDISEISQVSAQRLGNVQSGPATNASIADMSFKSGMEERLDIIKDYIITIVEGVIEVLKEISLEKESLSVEMPNGQIEKIDWSSADIQYAEVDISIDISSTIPDEVQVKRIVEYANWILNPIIMAGLQAQGKKIDAVELVRMVGKKILSDDAIDRIIIDDQGQVDPARENLIMMAGKPVMPLPTEDFNKHLQEHGFIKTHPIYPSLPDEIKMLIEKHILMTQQMVEQKQSMMAQQPGQKMEAPGGVGNLRAGAGNVA
jgi:hypothetical protein